MVERSVDLTAKLLIAMPGMGDPRFDRSVIFLCAHSADGAMGLIVNKPTPDLAFRDLLDQLGISSGPKTIRLPVHVGGPVEHGRGFVLHSADYGRPGSTLGIDDSFGMTATLEILEDIAKGNGPRSAILALGYAGWGPGQLENEIQRNGWLTCDASEGLVFETPDGEKWSAALNELGVDARLLSSTAGRA
jgi:putative transcriptional regulator